MHNEQHDLVHELPEYKDKIHEMKINNAHFARLFDEYHALNRDVIRMEMDIEPTSDAHLTELKKQRLHLKDELLSMLQQ